MQNTILAALKAGASEAEATLSVSDRFSVEARDRSVTKLEQATSKSLHVRVFAEGRKAALFTSDFDPGALQAALEQVVAQARHVAHDPLAGLCDTGAPLIAEDLELFGDDVAGRDARSKVDEALEIEALVRANDARITNSNGSHASDALTTVAIANSNGFAGSYRSTRASRSSSPVAIDGSAKRTGSYGTAGRALATLESPDSIARKAVRRTVEMFGARKPDTMRVPVIFDRDVAAAVLSDIFAAVSAANAAVGNSWLADRVGERIGSDLVTIVDDGRMPGKLGSSPFDGEGVATQRTVVFEGGVLKTLLYDTYYARKLGALSTGNSNGSGVGPNNFYLARGNQSLEELIASTERGILVLDTIGFATEHASGTYSRGARGMYIEKGEIAYPIDEFTVAGTYAGILAGIDGLADDLRFDAGVVAPSFRVAEMTISGN
ncbi:MAG: TldD/PmbA family protein [Candidatus Eremiobacteraeota bacterium]|nr:TldD/PmbA family protein [Candidatus Eremiobacteraeota bacterium]